MSDRYLINSLLVSFAKEALREGVSPTCLKCLGSPEQVVQRALEDLQASGFLEAEESCSLVLAPTYCVLALSQDPEQKTIAH